MPPRMVPPDSAGWAGTSCRSLASHAVSGLRAYAAGSARVLRRSRLRGFLGPHEDRLVFVVGCPRSGTTFTGSALGTLPGFVDLDEVTPLKAALPRLASLPA